MREVRERDYFFVASFAFVGVLLAAGFASAIRATAEWLGDRVSESNALARRATPVLALALVPLLGNRLSAPRNHETLASDFAVDMLQSTVEPYGILITAGRQRHLPALVRPGSARHPDRRNTGEPVADEYRLALPAPAAAARDAHLRPGGRTADVAQSCRRQQHGAVDRRWRCAGGWASSRPGPVFARSATLPDRFHCRGSAGAPEGLDAARLDRDQVRCTPTLTKSDVAVLFLIQGQRRQAGPIYFSWSDGGYPDQTFEGSRTISSRRAWCGS